MKALRNALLWIARLGSKPVHQVYLHDAPIGETVFMMGVYGEVLGSDGTSIEIAFDGDPEPFELFVYGYQFRVVRSKKAPSWKTSKRRAS